MKTILTAEFKHETNRYAPGITDFAEYERRNAVFGEAAVRERFAGAKNETTAFFHFFADKEDYEIIPVLAMNAAPGPVVEQSVWQTVADRLVEAIEKTPKVDGLLLSLHGAMATEDYEDGEGELLEVLRNKVGKDVPIIVSLDLHANITQKMVDNADGLFPFDYYPHTDMYETGLRAAKCMFRTLEGEVRPILRWSKLDVILPYMPTEHPAYRPFLTQTHNHRENGKMIDLGICHGFFAADIYEQGVAVLAVADGDADLAQQAANDLGKQIFAARKQLRRSFYTPEEAIRLAMESDTYPVVLAEVADNPGSGGSTDAVTLLKTLIEMGAQDVAMAVVYDPEVVAIAEKAGVGATIHVELGGKLAPQITGGPLECDAYVKVITDGNYRNRDKMSQGLLTKFGKCALLCIGTIQVIVCSTRTQPWDLEVYRHCGIQPQDIKILVVKSAAHFRASFSTVSKRILDVETPALAPQNPEMLPLARCRRPIYPLDDI